MEIVKATNIVLQQMLGGQSLTSSSAVSGFSLLYTLLLLLTSMGDSPARDQLMQTLDIGPAAVDQMLPVLDRLAPSIQAVAASFLRPEFGKFNLAITDLQQDKLRSGTYALHSVDDVNQWCSNATGGRIPTILQKLTDADVMVLASALHFKANWTRQFESFRTAPEPWTDLTGAVRDVDTMHLGPTTLPVWTSPVSTGVVLGYVDAPSVSAVISLPVEEGEAGLRAAIDEMARDRPEQTAQPIPTSIALPRFRVETTTDCLPVLAGLGLGPGVPFPVDAIDGSPRLSVSQAVQKVFLDVTEAGTEAAAVTALVLAKSALYGEPVTMEFNRPFLFTLVDTETGLRLFSAVVTEL